MDSFIEYMIKRKTTTGVMIKKILVYMAALYVSMFVAILAIAFIPMLMSVIFLVSVGLFYLAYRISSSFDVEFEYILTNGELDVDKIIHKKRRKRLMTIHSKSFIEFGLLQKGSNYFHDKKEYAKIIDASAKSELFDDYYAVFFKDGQRFKLIFNPTSKMIDIFKLYAPRVVK